MNGHEFWCSVIPCECGGTDYLPPAGAGGWSLPAAPPATCIFCCDHDAVAEHDGQPACAECLGAIAAEPKDRNEEPDFDPDFDLDDNGPDWFDNAAE